MLEVVFMLRGFIVILIILLMAGCNGKSNSTQQSHSENMHLMNTSNQDKQPITSKNGRSPASADVIRAKNVIWEMRGYTPHYVLINGKDMWVNVHTNDRLTSRERLKKQAEIRNKLKEVLPQYDIDVKLEEQ